MPQIKKKAGLKFELVLIYGSQFIFFYFQWFSVLGLSYEKR